MGKWGRYIKAPPDDQYAVFCVEAAILSRLEALEWTQVKLAKMLNMPKSNLNRTLHHLGSARFIRIVRICQALGLSIIAGQREKNFRAR